MSLFVVFFIAPNAELLLTQHGPATNSPAWHGSVQPGLGAAFLHLKQTCCHWLLQSCNLWTKAAQIYHKLKQRCNKLVSDQKKF